MLSGPNGKFMFGNVKVGEKGQIVIPQEARKLFGIKPGDQLLVLGDIDNGLAILTHEKSVKFLEAVMGGKKE